MCANPGSTKVSYGFPPLPMATYDYNCYTADSDEHQARRTSVSRTGSCFEVKRLNPTHHITSPLAKITAVSSSGLARDMQLTVCALGRHIFHTVAYIYICFHTNNKKDHFPQKRTNELQRAKLSKQEQKWAQICKIEQTQRQIKNKQKRIQKEQKWARKRYLKARMSPEEGKRTEIWTKKTEKLTKKSQKEQKRVTKSNKEQKRADKWARNKKKEPTRAQMVRNDQETRCSPRTRMLTRMLMAQMSKHMDMQSHRTLFCNSLIEQSCTYFPCYQSAVWSAKCRVWSEECGVCKVWSVKCGV